MDSRTTAGLLRGLVQFAFPAEADEFSKLIDRLTDEGKRRNVIAHSVWRKGDRPGSVRTFAIRAVGEIRYEAHDFTAAEMERLAERIREVRRDLIRFMSRLGYLRASPDKPTPQGL